MPRMGLTTDIVVEAAAAMADERGFSTLTLTELARSFDVKVASLYAHLKNSGDLNARLALYALDKLASRAEEAVAGRAGKDALLAVAHVHRDFAREHPGLFEAARYKLEGPFNDDNGGIRISRITRAALRGYALSETDTTHAMRLLGSFFLGFPMLELAGSFDHSRPSAETSWKRSLDALDALLRSWPTHK